MARSIVTVLCAGLWAAACSFDGGGAVTPMAGSDAGGDVEDASLADAPPADAMADAPPVCRDGDGDGFEAGGDSCAQPLDCDDGGPEVYPGQSRYFAAATAAGSFDYDCDGLEEPIDDRAGGECEFRDFRCRGDGWVDGPVPACGERGTYHDCGVVFFSCTELSRDTATQSCR